MTIPSCDICTRRSVEMCQACGTVTCDECPCPCPPVEDLLMYARWKCESHTPRNPDYHPAGLTCDEQGCWFCNVGDPDEMVRLMQSGDWPMPDADEIAEARSETEGE